MILVHLQQKLQHARSTGSLNTLTNRDKRHVSNKYIYHTMKTLVGKNIGEFSELMTNCQSLLPQIYRIFNIRILIVGHLSEFSSPNNLNS